MNAGQGPIRLDLHNHTDASPDGFMSPQALLERARARGIACIAVTDHGSIDGALACAVLAADDPSLPRVIVGEEIETEVGEVIGLFVHEEIPEGLPLEQTVERIRMQGGIVYLPHPCDEVRRSAVHGEARLHAARAADVVEVRNGRSLLRDYDSEALRLAAGVGALLGAGSDAHYPGEVGRAYLEVDRVPDRHDFVDVLRRGRPSPRPPAVVYTLSWLYLARSKLAKLRERYLSG